MNEKQQRFRWPLGIAVVLTAAVAAAVAVGVYLAGISDPEDAEIVRQVHNVCAACHAYPPPESFPRRAWKKEVMQGYQFARELRPDLVLPPMHDVLDYYTARAPEELDVPEISRSSAPLPVAFTRVGDGDGLKEHAVANVNIVHLFDGSRPEALACDMRANVVKLYRPYASFPRWEVLAEVSHPCRTEVVDLDGDGIKDILVACLGEFLPTDRPCGRLVWLRGDKAGRFTPVTLLDNVGRVSDVRAADFNGDGKLDLVVAVFGWRRIGDILLLENRTTDWSRPEFERRVLDPRHGAIHVPVADVNGDGRPDFVALISQEHETVVAFLNLPGGFRKEMIWTAPHPAYGSSGIQLTDLDGDGDLDVLYAHGDSVDNNLIRPEHGVNWLENRGAYPFVHHRLATHFGAHAAVAGDFDGDGDQDVVSVSFLPRQVFPQQKDLDSILLLEQTARGKFVRHSLERGANDHVTCAAGDLHGKGRIDVVIGNFTLFTKTADAIALWRNDGKAATTSSGKH